jgi:glutaminyl-tRNA synthetase
LKKGQEVGLKYAGVITLVDEITDSEGKVVELRCEYSSESKRTKGRIHWISEKDTAKVEARMYDYLFLHDEPLSLPEPFDALNPNSLIIRENALVNKTILSDIKPLQHFQFERVGYFVVDYDTNSEEGRYVFNLTVNL